jgi:hypothetical protein
MPTYWVGITGEPTPDQRERLCASGLRDRGPLGIRRKRTKATYFMVEAPSEETAIERVADALPELRDEWKKSPPHVIAV